MPPTFYHTMTMNDNDYILDILDDDMPPHIVDAWVQLLK